MKLRHLAIPAAAVVAAAALVVASSAAAGSPAPTPYAPVDRPGPALAVTQADLDASLACSGNVGEAEEDTVLFVPGTTLTPEVNFSWNWFRAMDQQGRSYCSVTVPNQGMTDIAVSAEYIVHAVRELNERTGRKVDVVGHSQGGLSPRFALRFWPDIRPMVDDYVGLAASNHGGIPVNLMCLPLIGCPPAIHQQTHQSAFTRAANSHQETFAGISYTAIYTRVDEFIQPNLNSSGTTSLRTGDGAITNVALQEVCPLNVSEHLLVGMTDPVAYALTMDALENPGPADPARLPKSVCTQLFMPGVNPATVTVDLLRATTMVASQLLLAPKVPTHPVLPSYVFE